MLNLQLLRPHRAGTGSGMQRSRAPCAYPERRLPVRTHIEGHGAVHTAAVDLHIANLSHCASLHQAHQPKATWAAAQPTASMAQEIH